MKEQFLIDFGEGISSIAYGKEQLRFHIELKKRLTDAGYETVTNSFRKIIIYGEEMPGEEVLQQFYKDPEVITAISTPTQKIFKSGEKEDKKEYDAYLTSFNLTKESKKTLQSIINEI